MGVELDVETVDLGDGGFGVFALGVSEDMVVLRLVEDIVIHARGVPALGIDDEGGDAGEVLLEGEDEQLGLETKVVAAFFGDAGGFGEGRTLQTGGGAFGTLETLLGAADAREILVEFVAVVPAEALLERAGFGEDDVEDAAGGAGVGLTKEAAENGAGILLGVGGVAGSGPRDALEIFRLLVIGEIVAAEFERGEHGVAALLLRDDLVERDVGGKGTVERFDWWRAREPAGAALRVHAGAADIGAIEASDEGDVGLDGCEWLEGGGQRPVEAGLRGEKGGLVVAVRSVDEGEAFRRRRGGGGTAERRGRHGVEHGQGERDAGAAEKRATREGTGKGEVHEEGARAGCGGGWSIV